jgi:hypothetical protein
MEKHCENCKYGLLSTSEHPCLTCIDDPMDGGWEPKGGDAPQEDLSEFQEIAQALRVIADAVTRLGERGQ